MFKDNPVVNPLADGYFSDKKAWKLYLKEVKSFLEELKNPFEKIEIGDRIEVYIPDRNPDGTRKATQVDVEKFFVGFNSPYDEVFSRSIVAPKRVSFRCFKAHEILDDVLFLKVVARYADPSVSGFAVGCFDAIEIVGRVD